ncbi:hypothetical protein TcasGA2_TC000579 [Tribolium castaneum]|uniref:Uncharacterized protein n=1 Tax=Tribolium castaneum TaxID=7070 RepID=D6W9H5_TRICA|nr:hypothetical protein TcasGA2_TC000579 [Tribolium castaneum]
MSKVHRLRAKVRPADRRKDIERHLNGKVQFCFFPIMLHYRKSDRPLVPINFFGAAVNPDFFPNEFRRPYSGRLDISALLRRFLELYLLLNVSAVAGMNFLRLLPTTLETS